MPSGTKSRSATTSLTRLLAAQSASFKRHAGYPVLVETIARSPALRGVRLTNVARRLLDTPRLKIQHVGNFLKTYRLPSSAFFEEFLEIKWELETRKRERSQKRALDIKAIMDSLPDETKTCIAYLAHIEATRNPGIPVWKKHLFPRTKKRARELALMTIREWMQYMGEYHPLLASSYRKINLPSLTILWACIALGCFPNPTTGALPSLKDIKSAFRTASKRHHPDSGGDPSRFRMAVQAKELLETQTRT